MKANSSRIVKRFLYRLILVISTVLLLGTFLLSLTKQTYGFRREGTNGQGWGMDIDASRVNFELFGPIVLGLPDEHRWLLRTWVVDVHQINQLHQVVPTSTLRSQYPMQQDFIVEMPTVCVACLTVGFLFWQSITALRRIQHATKCSRFGLCQKCGYDLRATHGCCPECGTLIPPDIVRKPLP